MEDVNTTGEARIKIIGVGGAGGNAVKNMVENSLEGVDFIIANTDKQALDKNPASMKIQLGEKATNGLGAGANPEKGKVAAEESEEHLRSVLSGSDMIFIAAGMGGGTGTGAAPVIARIAKDSGALTVGVVTKPFKFEGRRRMKQADAGITALQSEVDALIVIPNDRLLSLSSNISVMNAFCRADDVLLNAAKGITDLIVNSGYVNVDFMDVRTVMHDKGRALMGIGTHKGDNAAVEAVRNAISSPLLEDISIEGATGVLVNITCNSAMPLWEINEAAMLIEEMANEDANVIWGTVFDDSLDNEVRVTIIATGFEMQAESEIIEPARAEPTETYHGISRKPAQMSMNYKLSNTDQMETRRSSSSEMPVTRTRSQELPNLSLESVKAATPLDSEMNKPAYLRKLNTQHSLPPVAPQP
ncbi:MAG: cell division protein FtsZ [Deltaproteobacteria bacterium]|nr:cell division protein FtsZ [Deltaproteobacteria bacterium]